MDLFDDSGDGFLQKDEMVSLAEFKHRLQALKDDLKSTALDLSIKESLKDTVSKRTSIVKRMTSKELSQVSLISLEKEAQEALTEVAKEQDEIIARGEAIEETLQKALGETSSVVVDVWNPWPWTELFDKIASYYELETVEHFVAVFANIDVDGGGTIDQGEIFEALIQAGVEISEEGVQTLFNMIDEDGSGEIDQAEWREAADFYLELKEEEKEMTASHDNAKEQRQSLRAMKLKALGNSTRLTQERKVLGNSTRLTKGEKRNWAQQRDAESLRTGPGNPRPLRQSSTPEMMNAEMERSLGPKAKTIRFSENHTLDEEESWHPLEEDADENDNSENPLGF